MAAIVDLDTNIRGVWIADPTTGLPLFSGGANAQNIQGNVAAGSPDTGSNPVGIGGIAITGGTTASTSVTAGQRTRAKFTTFGQMLVNFYDRITTSNDGRVDGLGAGAVGSDGTIGLAAYVRPEIYDGASNTWFRLRGDAGGMHVQPGALPAGTDRSGTANTASAQLAAANASRRGLNIQNIGLNNIGVNEVGGTAAIGTAGTYTLTPGSSMTIRTNRLINAIAMTGATAYTATEF